MKKQLPFLIVALAIVVLFPFNRAEAVDGAMILNVGTPSVSGSAVTLSATTNSGTVQCGDAPERTPFCFCCDPTFGDKGDWQTCQVESASYTISGPVSRSGSMATVSNQLSPSGCSLQCIPAAEGGRCSQQRGFSLSESSLPAGSYTAVVTATDCRGTRSASRTFTIEPTLAGGCDTPQSSYQTGTQVRWNGWASGGTGSYSYSWSGTDGLSGSGTPVYKTYSSAGTKTANLTVTSGSQTKSVSCTVAITTPPTTPPVTATCSASPASPQTNQTVTWTAVPSGGNGTYTYSWTGNGSFPTGATGNPVSAVYTGEGKKNAHATVTSGGQSVTASCSVVVSKPPQPTDDAEVRVHSNRNATFSLSGPTPQSGSLTASTTRSFAPSTAGTYTISPAPQANCTSTVSPSATQSVAGGGVITFNISYTCTTPAVSCSVSPASPQTGQAISVTGAGGTTYTWSAPGGTPATGSGNPFQTVYYASGGKTVTVTSGGQSGQCTVNVNAPITQTLTCDIRANNSDGPVTIPYGGSVFLTWGTNGSYAQGGSAEDPTWWCPSATSACKPRNGNETRGPLYTSRTYQYTCGGYGTYAYDTVTVNVLPPPCIGNVNVASNVATTWSLTGPSPQTQGAAATSKNYTGLTCGTYTITPATLPGYTTPNPAIAPVASQTLSSGGALTYTFTYTPFPSATVDLKANGSDNPPAIITGSQAALSWTTANIKTGSCVASNGTVGWPGAKDDNGSQNSAAVNAQTTFTLTCRNVADTANVVDSVTVSVRPAQCEDGIDNDGDGEIDGDDPGCGGGDDDDDDDDDDDEGNTWPQCSDNVDNADPEDTLADEDDPGCWTDPSDPNTYDPDDNEETNAGVVIGDCNDGLDNDGDGTIDSADAGCANDSDPSELGEPDIREI